MTTGPAHFDPLGDLRLDLRRALLLAGVLVVGVGGLSGFVQVNGAVIATGRVDDTGAIQRIQHPTGGVVSQIRVHDGSVVRAGDVLLVLDPTVSRASATITSNAVDALAARQARLESERDGAAQIRFPADLLARRDDANVATLLRGETDLFRLRAGARAGQEAQLRSQKTQIAAEIRGLEDQKADKIREIAVVSRELDAVRKLYDQHLVPLVRLDALERDAEELQSQVHQLGSSAASERARLSELDLRIIQLGQESRSQAGAELSDVVNQLAELRQRSVAAQSAYSHIELRAGGAGVVEQLAVENIGAVIAPGQVVMDIVSASARPRIEARVRAQDAPRVRPGRPAVVRTAALQPGMASEIAGQVERISSETSRDERSGAEFYTVTIVISPEAAHRAAGLQLSAGAPVEVYIQTPPRSLLSYVTEPLADQFRRAFRED